MSGAEASTLSTVYRHPFRTALAAEVQPNNWIPGQINMLCAPVPLARRPLTSRSTAPGGASALFRVPLIKTRRLWEITRFQRAGALDRKTAFAWATQVCTGSSARVPPGIKEL